MKVIFLDYDGVIQTVRSKFKPDPESVAHLNLITDATQARIVVSSTWRRDGLKANRARLREWGVTGKVFSTTPDLSRDRKGFQVSVERGHEIGFWLQFRTQGFPIDSAVILDDDKDMGPFRHLLIQTNPHVGLTTDDVKQAILMLGETQMPILAAPQVIASTPSGQLPPIGQRLTILGTHPHAGKSGEVLSYGQTFSGFGAVIQLDDGQNCFVFPNDKWLAHPSVTVPRKRREKRLWFPMEYDL